MEFINEPARRTAIKERCDLCVIGGSCTGVFAAVRAARLGLSVALVERHNVLGGTAVTGLVNIWHSLHDIYDAKNVANLMMDRNTIVVVNLSLLSEDQSKRAMDFLDGAKYVTKSVFARFTESICAFIPSDIELHGDFYNQVEL